MTMDSILREASPRDVERLLPLVREYYAEDAYPFDEEAVRRALAALVSSPELGRVWIVLDGEDVVGYVAITYGFSIEYKGRDAFVDEVFVRAEHRGRGLG